MTQALREGGFLERTPLWYYMLKEAEVRGVATRLGDLGSRIVAETVIGVLFAIRTPICPTIRNGTRPSRSRSRRSLAVDGRPDDREDRRPSRVRRRQAAESGGRAGSIALDVP